MDVDAGMGQGAQASPTVLCSDKISGGLLGTDVPSWTGQGCSERRLGPDHFSEVTGKSFGRLCTCLPSAGHPLVQSSRGSESPRLFAGYRWED